MTGSCNQEIAAADELQKNEPERYRMRSDCLRGQAVQSRLRIAVMGALLLSLFLISRGRAADSNLISGIGYFLVIAALVASFFAYPRPTPEQRRQNFRALLGIRRPEETGRKVFEFVAEMVFFVGSLLLFLFLGPKYVLLDGHLYLGLLYAIPVFLLISLLVPPFRVFNQYPLFANIAGRLFFCIPAVALLATIVLVVNCAPDQSKYARIVTCLGKRASLGKKPNYYVRLRPWNNSAREVEVDVPRDVYVGLTDGTPLRLTTGQGRLGLEWIRRIEICPPTSLPSFSSWDTNADAKIAGGRS